MELDHVTAVVQNPDAARIFEELLQVAPIGRAKLPGMSIVTFRLGNIELHLNAPTGPGPVHDHFEAHGPSLHHIAFQVRDLDAALAALAERGYPARGVPAQTAPGLREVFLEPSATAGLWVQLVERTQSVRPEDLDASQTRNLAEGTASRPSLK